MFIRTARHHSVPPAEVTVPRLQWDLDLSLCKSHLDLICRKYMQKI